ncbi:restriction endonuclease subunit S [Mordavella massiliensis]|uniref:restriction endonuclease subunit S n=1 Tax=Mordavella massiliensis TaxID=1871024 RepID=UPI00210EE1D4|nr:restriction endonuclease subunit S [Mordavella massiliensis]
MSKSDENKRRVPKLRFPGFTEDWEQRKLGKLVSFSKGSGYSKGDLKEVGTPIILYGRLYTKYETVISEVDTFVDEKAGSVYSKGGEVIVPGSGETAEDISIASVVEKPGILLGGDLNVITPPANLDAAFLAISISNGKPHSDMAKMAQGKSVVHLHNSDLAKIDFPYPSYEEQCKISGYFTNFDHLITLHQRKCDRLKELKKGLLQKMFPKNGEKIPELRFPGFTEDWEQRKVGELLIERNEQSPMSDEYPLMAFIANEGVAPKGERYDRSALVADTENKLYKRTEFGDFIYSSNNLETGSIGLNKYGKACISPVYSIFQPTGIADSNFLGRRLVRKDFINSMVKWRQGVIYGQWKIHESDFLKIEIPVPSVEEQRQIGDFLDDLDNLITLHQRKLEHLKELKKGLLQQMFV